METMTRSIFLRSFQTLWKQGEHLTIIGPTGSGKSTLGLQLLSSINYVAIIATKQRDSTLETFAKRNRDYRIINEFHWSIKQKTLDNRVIVWPKLSDDAGDISKQTIPIRNSLNILFFQGAWTIFVDELWVLTNRLRLQTILESYWSQGRSSGLAVIGCVQRPAFIPRLAFSEPRYLLIGQMEDKRDVETVSNGTNINARILAEEVNKLSRHAFLFYSRNDRSLIRIDE